MRARQVVRIDRATGGSAGYVELVPGEAGIAQRFAELRASLPADVDGERFAWISCDGCPARAGVDPEDPRLPGGWVTIPGGDFCPACCSSG